jgi:alpha-tubulin suppressor-like RCC1 family protein
VIITSTGQIYSMGSNVLGQLGINDPMIKSSSKPILLQDKFASEVSCGENHTLIISQQGVYAWGANDKG